MRVEALEWLKARRERYIYGLCGNRQNCIQGIQALYKAEATKVEVENDTDATATIYITINPEKITKQLLVEIVKMKPDEFWELENEPNVFRYGGTKSQTTPFFLLSGVKK